MSPSAEIGARTCFLRCRLRTLSRSAGSTMPQAWCRGLVLLPDAQSRPSDPRPRPRGGVGRAVGETHRRYSAVANARKRGDRACVSIPLRIGGHGRGSPLGRRALCRAEPSASAAGLPLARLALVERPRPSGNISRIKNSKIKSWNNRTCGVSLPPSDVNKPGPRQRPRSATCR